MMYKIIYEKYFRKFIFIHRINFYLCLMLIHRNYQRKKDYLISTFKICGTILLIELYIS